MERRVTSALDTRGPRNNHAVGMEDEEVELAMAVTMTTSHLHGPHSASNGTPAERPGSRARRRAAPASHEGGAPPLRA
jgi:hypothetical protein